MYDNAADKMKALANEFFPGVPFETAVVLGSGLGAFPSRFENAPSVSYSEIEGLAASTAPGHEGKLYFITLGGKGVYCFSGRTHYYEGLGMERVVYAVRVMKKAGVRNLMLTNAAGGIDRSYRAGEFMLIKDHINMMPNPLVGKNDSELGVRFPDMTVPYDKEFAAIVKESAASLGITLHEGVYIGVQGPSYETPAEINAYRIMGANAVGMSTVPEVIAARHCGIRVCAVTLVANAAAGMNKEPLTEQEVIEAGIKASHDFGDLAEKVLTSINTL